MVCPPGAPSSFGSGLWAFARTVLSARSALSSPCCFWTTVHRQLLWEPPSWRVAWHPPCIQSSGHMWTRGRCPRGVHVYLPSDSPASAHPQAVSPHGRQMQTTPHSCTASSLSDRSRTPERLSDEPRGSSFCDMLGPPS